MEQMIMKTEVEDGNGEALVFYVDENGQFEEGVMSIAIENLDPSSLERLQQMNYVIESIPEQSEHTEEQMEIEEIEVPAPDSIQVNNDGWSDDDIHKLLIFYTDNKGAFNIANARPHLWSVACKTMLSGKNPNDCELKLHNLKTECAHMFSEQRPSYWKLLSNAFQDDSSSISEGNQNHEASIVANNVRKQSSENNTYVTGNERRKSDGIIVTKKPTPRVSMDQRVDQMLRIYLETKRKNEVNWNKFIWEKIAIVLGEDGEYWSKRFLNFKQHYLRMLDKRHQLGPSSIVWPYMQIFDEIYQDDPKFQQKYNVVMPWTQKPVYVINKSPPEWNNAEKTILVKYCFDCYDEFLDPTIPNNFLWNEVGRLLDKKSEICKMTYEKLKKEHLEKYLNGYKIDDRIPIEILFDNIISKQTQKTLADVSNYSDTVILHWSQAKLDALVEYFHENSVLFKDFICHFVCWAAISKKLQASLTECLHQWRGLTSAYKTILNDKKEYPDMEIEWQYIDLFDRLFDYGMDTKLLDGYEKKPDENSTPTKVAKIPTPKTEDEISDVVSDDEDYDPQGATKRSRGESIQFRILEYYQKNKDKFSNSQNRKQALWDVLAKQIGITSEQCAHRFRNFKQVYTSYVQREINKPEMPILWPYYTLCKKVFGYRAIKNKLKSSKESDDSEDWTTREIKQVINYFARNFEAISNSDTNSDLWTELAVQIGRSANTCREKFLELRKSYRKICTMRNKNPEWKITWRYFKMLDEIFSQGVDRTQDVNGNGKSDEMDENTDEDYHCIIVLPEDENINNAKIIIQNNTEDSSEKPTKTKVQWTNSMKKYLLKSYYQYLIENKCEVINLDALWVEIAKKLNLPQKKCKNMFIKLRRNHNKKLQEENLTYKKSYTHNLLNKILALYKTLLVQSSEAKDVDLPLWKVEKALQYYLQHIEDFVSPKYDKRYTWKELATHSGLGTKKAFRKINYLKTYYNCETNDVAGTKYEFCDTIREILEKEFVIKIALGNEPLQEVGEIVWTDEEVERILTWYSEHADQFKDPKLSKKYIWHEIAIFLNKNTSDCSKKLIEIKKMFRQMLRESPETLPNWRFFGLCQHIFGLGKVEEQTT